MSDNRITLIFHNNDREHVSYILSWVLLSQHYPHNIYLYLKNAIFYYGKKADYYTAVINTEWIQCANIS